MKVGGGGSHGKGEDDTAKRRDNVFLGVRRALKDNSDLLDAAAP